MTINRCLILFVLLCVLFQYRAARADEDEEDGKLPFGTVTSIEAFGGHGDNHEATMLAAQYSLREGNLEQAINLCRRALNQDDDDLDLHQLYAESLEKKLKRQVQKDPALFNECVKQWLIVLRSEVGDEKGMSWHGLSLPISRQYEDEERQLPARVHLTKLTGFAPKQWETDTKYLRRVCKPVDTTVTGKVVDADKGKSSSSKAQAKARHDEGMSPAQGAQLLEP